MLQASNDNFQKKRIELEVSYGKKITFTKTDKIAEELVEHLRETKNVLIHLDFCLSLCAVCELQWKTGDFAKETLLLIPKPRDCPSDAPKVRVTIPRVVCLSCSESLCSEDGAQRIEASPSCTLTEAWRLTLEHRRSKAKKIPSTPNAENTVDSVDRNPSSNEAVHCGGGFKHYSSTQCQDPLNFVMQDPLVQTSQRQEGENSRREKESGSVTSTSDNNSSSSGGESMQNIVDQKGFMVCTQLVRTGRADLAGLKAGDVFTKFGNMTKENFEGLKSVANFVRRNASKSFEAVVLRQVNGGSKQQKQGTFRKVRLTLTPLNCKDIDGGGVLGAVINTWPIPVSETVQE